MKNKILLGSLVFVLGQTGCKSRLFSFSSEPSVSPTSAPIADTGSGQIAIGTQKSGDAAGQAQTLPSNQKPAVYTPLKDGSQKTLQLGKTTQYMVGGQSVEVTFVSILEDSRCPKDVVCIWEGQARLQFKVSISSMNLSKTVEPILRAGHPELAQVSVGAVGLDLVGLNPDTATQKPSAQKVSPEATLIVGKAP